MGTGHCAPSAKDPWAHEVVAGRLAGLDTGSDAVIWTQAAGLVRVHCLQAGRLWAFTPVAGRWLWLIVGANDVPGGRLWTVTYGDRFHAPEQVRTTNLGATSALWDAVEFLADHFETEDERHMVVHHLTRSEEGIRP